FDDGDLPAQAEPEMADGHGDGGKGDDEKGDNGKIVPAAATKRGAGGRAAAVAVDDAEIGLNDMGTDTSAGAPSKSKKQKHVADPFGDLNGVEELEAPDPRASARPAPVSPSPKSSFDEGDEEDGIGNGGEISPADSRRASLPGARAKASQAMASPAKGR